MLHPKLVLTHDISSTKLATLPVHSETLSAGPLGDMLVDFGQFKSDTAFLTFSKHVVHLALIEQVICDFPNVDETSTLLAGHQHLAVIDEVIPVVLTFFVWFVAVVAYS